MGTSFRLQSSRFELKFLIDEGKARAIRDFVRSYLVSDEASVDECGYRVNSLYLDSPDLRLYRQTIQGLKNRFKLRIRFYDEQPESPAFLEIKTRLNDEIRKERAAVTREGVCRLLGGYWPNEEHVLDQSRLKGLGATYRFCNLRDSLSAIPAAYVSYRREAYVSPHSEHIRVTFDRRLGAGRHFGTELALPKDIVPAKLGGVVLELKFTDRFPNWMNELVQIFNLQRCSVPKYILCAEALGLARDGHLAAALRQVG